MMIRYKLANKKLSARLEETNDDSEYSKWRLPPKRVSCCSLQEEPDFSSMATSSSSNSTMLNSPLKEELSTATGNWDRQDTTGDNTFVPILSLEEEDRNSTSTTTTSCSRRLSFGLAQPGSPPTIISEQDFLDDQASTFLSSQRVPSLIPTDDTTNATTQKLMGQQNTPSPTTTMNVETISQLSSPSAHHSFDAESAANILMSLRKKALLDAGGNKTRSSKRLLHNTRTEKKPDQYNASPLATVSESVSDGNGDEPPSKKAKKTPSKRRSNSKPITPMVPQHKPSPRGVLAANCPVRTPGISMAMPDDPEELNSLHCFVRSDLLELFVLNDYSSAKGRDQNRSIQKVGFRCVHCGHLPRKHRKVASMSSFFPKSLDDIYRGVCTWQRIHFKACPFVPKEVSCKYHYLKETDRTRGKKTHWVNSAYRLGLRNADNKRGGVVWSPDQAVDVI